MSNLSNDELVRVMGRGGQFYMLPELNVYREFGRNEIKKVPFGEIMALFSVPGGKEMIINQLVVERKALEALGIDMSDTPEYFYTRKQIKDIMFGTNNLDEFDDMCTFAPDNVKEIICEIAVKEKLYDDRKKKIIFDKFNFNVDTSIEINKMMNEGLEEEVKKEKPKRKAGNNNTNKTTSSAPKRKTAAKKVEDIQE